MKTIKKTLCVILSIVMMFSCVSVAGLAAESNQFKYSLRYESERPDSYNADVVLDILDEVLAEADIYKPVEITSSIALEIDLRSVNELCDTFDDFEDLLSNLLIKAAVAVALGDLKDLEFDTWKTGMKRGSQDTTIVKELIEFLNANGPLISKVCSGELDLGLANSFVDIEDLLGEDGVSGMLKEMLIDIVYDGNDVDTNYAKYKGDIDSFIYGDLIGKYADEYLPGFKIDQNSKVKDLICLVAGLVLDEYIIPAIKDINIDLKNEESEELKALDGLVNLKGSTYNFSGVTVKNNGDFLSQANDIAGAVFGQIIPGYQWQTGSWDKINDNIEGALKYLGVQSGLIPEAATMSFNEIFMEVISIVTRNVDLGVYGEGLGECESLEQVITVLLMNVAYEEKLNVNYKGNESWELVLGDILAEYMYDKFDITDYNGKSYREGGGKDVYEVANYVLNYFLFDKGVAAVMGLETTKTADIFTKIDLLADYFGETKAKGIAFNSKNFLLGANKQKGLLDAILDLDIESVIGMTAVKAINAAGDKSAVEFIYKTVQYAVNNWAGGKELLPPYTDKAFTNALSNTSIAKLVKELLGVLNSRKDSIVPLAFFSVALLTDTTEKPVEVTSVSVSDFKATGNRATPAATVKAGGKTLVQGVDFDVVTYDKVPGPASAIIKGIGLYEGEINTNYKIILNNMGTVKVASQSATSIKLTWNKVPYADKYNVYYTHGGKQITKSVTTESITVTSLTPGTKYTFKVEAEDVISGKSVAKEVKTVTKPDAVKSSSIKYTATDSSLTLTWSKASGAVGYKVDQYVNNAWKEVASVTKTTATIKGLKAYTSYKFRIRSYTADHNNAAVIGDASSTVTAKTILSPATVKATPASATSIKLSWNKVNDATAYQVYQYVGSAWKSIKKVTGTSHTVTGLKPGTKYSFKVEALDSSGIKSAAKEAKTITKPNTVKGLKATTVTASSVTLTWSKASGAVGYKVDQYVNNAWKEVASVTKTTATIKGLKGYTSYKFRIRSYTTDQNKATVSGDASSSVTAKTKFGSTTLKAASSTATTVKLSWSKVNGAQGYQVYQYVKGAWKSIKKVTGTSLTVTGLKANTKYKFKIRAYAKTKSGYDYSPYAELSTTTKLAKPSSVKVTKTTATAATLSWSKVSGAQGYQVYKYVSGAWKLVKNVTGTSLTVSSLKSGTKTNFRVRAYKKSGSSNSYGDYSSTVTALTLPAAVKGIKAASRTKSAIKLSWTKTTGATGYEIYRYNGGKWVKIATTKSTSYTNSKLKKNTEFKYKIRAYQKVGKTTKYGAYSSVFKTRTRLF